MASSWQVLTGCSFVISVKRAHAEARPGLAGWRWEHTGKGFAGTSAEPVLLGLPQQIFVSGFVQLEGKEQVRIHDVNSKLDGAP
jgi:hypothetical protein